MIAFLKSDAVERPKLLDRPPSENLDHIGYLTSSLDDCSVVLKRQSDGRAFQLLWKKGSGGKDDRRRALPPGEYQITGYRIARRDTEGHDWFISGAGKIRTLKVHAGHVQDLKLMEVIGLTCRALPRGGDVQVQAIVQGEHHCGLSIWKDGLRIPIHFRIADAAGKELASGTLKYG
jgi:hypothetical protein